MVLKHAFSGLISTAALTGAVLIATIAPGSACPFSQKFNAPDPVNTAPTDFTSNQINLNQPDVQKLGIAAASLVALFGLYGGGMVLKSRLAKRPVPVTELPPAAESPTEYPTFPIEVPAMALEQTNEVEQPIVR